MNGRRFFNQPEEQSLIKSLIVTKYFSSWSKIMQASLRYDKRIAYVDLFSGPGRYEDGTPSTPILLLDQAIANQDLRDNLLMIFNDENRQFAESLRILIRNFPDVSRFKYFPEVWNHKVGETLIEMPSTVSSLPSLFFIDPWGYKGLSLDLIGRSIANWGCDCIFFFNYNRINPGISNPYVEPIVREIFGTVRFEMLRTRLAPMLEPEKRQLAIIEEFTLAIKDIGGKYVIPFEFESDESDRTSHYIVFVSKHFLGYKIMRDVMFSLSSDRSEVRRLGFVPIKTSQMGLGLDLFDPNDPYSIEFLKRLLVNRGKGRTLSVEKIFELFSPDTPYVSRHFKRALSELEIEGLLTVEIPAAKRKKRNGEPTLADRLMVTFTT